MRRIYTPNEDEFPKTVDAVIIGGGIIGAAVAFFLSREGVDTIVVERKEGLGNLATAASSECIRAQFLLPEHIDMMKASIDMLEHFSALIGIPDYDIGLRQPGYLFLTSSDDGNDQLETRVARQHASGLSDVELLRCPELQKRFSYVSPDATAATFRQGDGWFSTHRVTYGLAKGGNARFWLQTEVQDFLVGSSGIKGVQTNRGLIEAGIVVLAAGPFSGDLAKRVGIDLPLELFDQQEAVIHHCGVIPRNAPVTIDLDTAAFWRPEPGGAMVSTGGLTLSAKPKDPVPTDRSYAAFAIEAASRLSPFWLEVAESLKSPDVSVQAGQNTITPDHKAIIGPCQWLDGLYLSVGHSGHGVMSALEAGRLLCAIIRGDGLDYLNPFSLARFQEDAELTTETMA